MWHRMCQYFYRVLRRTNTVKVKWRLPSFTGRGRPQVPLHALFQAPAGTRVESPTFRKLAILIYHILKLKIKVLIYMRIKRSNKLLSYFSYLHV